ncbi:MAG: S9 family peptidase, partial [Candidatus Eremiobacteraeota bacterium]|nr:S9 family peptidase [Candidatus Eremiobacteraeota bacterium]
VEVQRPDLFGAAIPQVGVLDMLRFDKFTIGNAWIPEYGCSTCGQSDFDWLIKYSPVHNVKPAAYPPTLIMTADHDDRVFPAHSFKFAAAMQAAQTGDAPVLLRIESKAGHGAGTPITKSINEYADMYAFLAKNLNVPVPQDF